MKTQNLFRGILILFSVFYLMPLFAQTESKIAIITVTGSGKTQDDAKQNALRNAIEQAFGTFISSNTQILNDELVKDEIVSVSSGNIQEYTVLSEVQTPDGYWSNTVKAKVAIDKLTSFCESKGVTANLKGSLFSYNIKLQELNKDNEVLVIDNMNKVLKNIVDHSFDYEINIKDPYGDNGLYYIPLQFIIKANNNFFNFDNYLIETLQGITLSQNEVENIESTGGTIYKLGYGKLNSNELLYFYFRSPNSILKILDLILYLRKAMLNFTIESETFTIDGNTLWDSYRQPYGNFKFEYFRPSNPLPEANPFVFGDTFMDDPEDRYKAEYSYYKYVPGDVDKWSWDAVLNYHYRYDLGKFITINFNKTDPKEIFAYEFHYLATLSEISKINSIKISPNY